MGNFNNVYKIDATIMSFYFDTDDECFKIECNPSYGIMTLKRNHPNFINLYKKLKIGLTYNFICSNWLHNIDEIVDITDCLTYTTCDTVIGFLDIQHELYALKNYDEIVLKNDTKKRFLINKNIKQNITTGKQYEITCIKKFGDNFYNILDFKCKKNEI